MALGARGVSDLTIDQCISAAIGVIDVPPGTPPGQLLHPVAN
ncbi:hypothetical protein DB32_004008 [Sandaracinus amylolyticus]|uniref:Uncharacterized protein n=1 Tax=Sandaracinus amylolyticus TaxID=927083 RepID=A0A0F6SFF6_9BACT|nr:hypothetical protein DB32_004008 [Sandaracinus amylolyticus]